MQRTCVQFLGHTWGLTPTDNSSSKGSNALYRHTHEMHINLRKPTHIHTHSQVTTNKKHGKLRIMWEWRCFWERRTSAISNWSPSPVRRDLNQLSRAWTEQKRKQIFTPSSFFLIFRLIYFIVLYTWGFCLCVCALCWCLVLEEVRRHEIPQGWSCRWLWTTLWVLGTDPGSSVSTGVLNSKVFLVVQPADANCKTSHPSQSHEAIPKIRKYPIKFNQQIPISLENPA